MSGYTIVNLREVEDSSARFNHSHRPATMRAFEAGPDGLEWLAFGAPIARRA